MVLEKQKKLLKKDKKEKQLINQKQKSKSKVKKKKRKIFAKKEKKEITSQNTLGYKTIYPDGICKVDDNKYSKTIRFEDINYRIESDERQEFIFESYSELLKYFDSEVDIQLTYMNVENDDVYSFDITIDDKEDEFNDIRKEYSEYLRNQFAKGNNGIVKMKYITFSINALTYKEAKSKLERIDLDILSNFKKMGVKAYSLEGKERIELLRKACHLGSKENSSFSWDLVKKSGISTKDFIAPNSFNFNKSQRFKIANMNCAVSHLQIFASDLKDTMLSEILEIEENMIVNFHIKSIDQNKAVRFVKQKLTSINTMKVDEQKKAVNSGYDMDLMPSDLKTFGSEAEQLLSELQDKNEKMFLITILIYNVAKSKQKLEDVIFQVNGIVQKHNCNVQRLDYQQERGFTSSLPLGDNRIEINRAITASGTAVFIPFTTKELFMNGQYYGLNTLSNGMIMCDRKNLRNPNGLVLGTPGSGKTFSVKREITDVYFTTDDDIIICDPEGEYYPLVNDLKGQIITISANSKNYINPLDIDLYNGEDDPIKDKSEFIMSLCEQVIGGKFGLEGREKTLIDRCVRLMYEKYMENPLEENMPILEDFYNLLIEQDNEVALDIAERLELYVHGSFNVFNNRTNINYQNRVICFDIKELKSNLRKMGMLIIQDAVWARVGKNRKRKKATRYYIDEIHLLLRDKYTAAYTVEFWKRFRKWGGIPTGITQNVKDFLASYDISSIIDNSDFICLLNQGTNDRKILSEFLEISEEQQKYITNSEAGEGLLKYDDVIIPFKDKFPTDTKLYKLMTTKPSEVAL